VVHKKGYLVRTVIVFTLEYWKTTWCKSERESERNEKCYKSISRADKPMAASICNKSVIINHLCSENYVIEWDSVKVID